MVIKSELRTSSHSLGLGREIVVRPVCFTLYLQKSNKIVNRMLLTPRKIPFCRNYRFIQTGWKKCIDLRELFKIHVRIEDLRRKQVYEAGISTCPHSIVWDAITNPCRRYMLLAPKSAIVLTKPTWVYWWLSTRGPFYKHGLTLIPTWINNRIHYEVWDEITHPFPTTNFNCTTIEVGEWINTFIPHFNEHVITYPCWDLC